MQAQDAIFSSQNEYYYHECEGMLAELSKETLTQYITLFPEKSLKDSLVTESSAIAERSNTYNLEGVYCD